MLEAVRLIMGGPYTVSFWMFVVGAGIAFPLGMEVYELTFHEPVAGSSPSVWLTGAAPLSVLFGGFMLRYVIPYAGQIAQVIPS